MVDMLKAELRVYRKAGTDPTKYLEKINQVNGNIRCFRQFASDTYYELAQRKGRKLIPGRRLPYRRDPTTSIFLCQLASMMLEAMHVSPPSNPADTVKVQCPIGDQGCSPPLSRNE